MVEASSAIQPQNNTTTADVEQTGQVQQFNDGTQPEQSEEFKTGPIANERCTSVMQSQVEAPGELPSNTMTSARQVLPTVKGLVNKDAVREIMQANIPPDAPVVKMISSN